MAKQRYDSDKDISDKGYEGPFLERIDNKDKK